MKKILLFIAVSALTFSSHAQIKYIDKANMDLTVKPGDNFYAYANGGWLKTTVMPSTKTRWGSFDILREESSQNLKTLLEEAAGKKSRSRVEQMCGDFYASGMDSMQLEKLGAMPVKKDLEQVDAEVFIVELKAAAIDVVAEVALERGVDVVLAANDVVPLASDTDLDERLLGMAKFAS